MTEETKKNETPVEGVHPIEDGGLEQMAGGATNRRSKVCRFCGKRFTMEEIIAHERSCPNNPNHDTSPEIL